MGNVSRSFALAILCASIPPFAPAAESDALAISANIQALHMPFGTIMDPIYASASSTQIVAYTRCGDSALWTGAYLAAESFRYKVTQSPAALVNVRGALAGLTSLVDVTGDNRVARCRVPTASPYAQGIAAEEAANTIHQNPPYLWVDNTSRDQVVGVFFGLAVAFDMVDDPAVKSGASDLATRMIGFIANHQWSPNDDISNTFMLRPEELQMLLQVARHLNPANTVSGPFLTLPVGSGVAYDVQSNSSYFKFNLDYMTFYNLVRLQDNSDNRGAYLVARTYTASHQNAFFDMVDRALQGPNATRDSEAASLLDQWLKRPTRDFFVDVTKTVTVCGSEACKPVPVAQRPPATYLWQDDPFQLTGGGSGVVESAGVDYILPYWMARYYGVAAASNAVQSAAAPLNTVAAGSLASLFGGNLTTTTAQAGSQPLPTQLANVSVNVTDSAGMQRLAPLIYASPGQINFEVPEGTAPGAATATVTSSPAQTFTAAIQTVAPALFAMNGAGSGIAAATAISVQAPNGQLQTPVPVFQCTGATCVGVPINLGVDTPIYVTFYGTGIRNRSALSNVSVTINGVNVPVLYAGPAPNFTGLDQVNVGLVLSLRGSGMANVVLTVDGQTSNTVTLDIQ
jgi:uncharacterized protein (TIGR03437 family)